MGRDNEEFDHKLLCLTEEGTFVGKDYFVEKKSTVFADFNIDAKHEHLGDDGYDSLDAIEDDYPVEDLDGLLVHRLDFLNKVINQSAFEGVPLLIGGHLLPRGYRTDLWKSAVESGREMYLFTGSVRSARCYSGFGNDNVNFVISPIMGRSKDHKLQPDFIPSPDKKYDIGFFSVIDEHKRPHSVIMAAAEIAERLEREITVWIAGFVNDNTYRELLDELVEYHSDSNISVEIVEYIPNEELFKRVQETKAIYLPAVYGGETTCYAAWETISYDTPLIGADWAGVGEAARQGRHPKSKPIPLKSISSVAQLFSSGFLESTIGRSHVEEELRLTPFKVKEDFAINALVEAITFDHEQYSRQFEIPDRVNVESTVSAFRDIFSGEVPYVSESYATRPELGLVDLDDRLYSVLVDPYASNMFALQAMTDSSISE